MTSKTHAATERRKTSFVINFPGIIRYFHTFFSAKAKGIEVMCGGKSAIRRPASRPLNKEGFGHIIRIYYEILQKL